MKRRNNRNKNISMELGKKRITTAAIMICAIISINLRASAAYQSNYWRLGSSLSHAATSIGKRIHTNSSSLYHPSSEGSSSLSTKKAGRNHSFFQTRHVTSMSGTASSDLNSKIPINENNWKDHPSLTETLHIPTIIVPSEHLHSLIGQGKDKGILVPFLATQMKELENIHPGIKAVQNLDRIGIELKDAAINSSQGMKAILLDPHTVNNGDILSTNSESSGIDLVELLSTSFPNMSTEVIQGLASKSAKPGPLVPIELTYKQQPIQHILSKLLPEEAQPPPTGYEQIGHVVHLNLKAHHEPYRKLIGAVILDRLSPKIQTVVNKIGEVSGPYRTYEMDVLAGRPDTTVRLNEDGIALEFDLSKVYWCTRLSGERKRLLEEFKQGEIIADAFCGAGAFVVQAAAKLGCTVYANDLNPDAVRYCRENAKRNHKKFNGGPGEDGEVTKKPKVIVTCGDAFDFIQNLGNMDTLPHHVVMNFPLDSASFLGALRWWPVKDATQSAPIVHLYTFARADFSDEFKSDDMPPRDAAEVAVDLVAEGLVPEGGAIEESRYRRSFLDKMGCDVQAREVRDVAPGKVVICVSFKVTATLLRIMQGDFVDF
jgi:tRNA (guanine37-N1)-methyltransferase